MTIRLTALILVLAGLTLPARADESFGLELARAGLKSANADITYNGAYRSITYPWGDVPADQGVCTDVVIRAYRELDVDLQKRVHEDMKASFAAYPSKRVWGLSRPDRNIDHRRVLNLEVFLKRAGAALPVSQNASDYRPGDLVSWRVPKYGGGTTPHIGLVTAMTAPDGEPLIVHHLSGKPLVENVLFTWPITGHYRYHVAAGERDR
jgi:hypothetical protein